MLVSIVVISPSFFQMVYLCVMGRNLLSLVKKKEIGEINNVWRRLEHLNKIKSPDIFKADGACNKDTRKSCTEGKVDYNRIFLKIVQESKRNNTYWEMQSVQKSHLFPYADEYTDRGRKVSIW